MEKRLHAEPGVGLPLIPMDVIIIDEIGRMECPRSLSDITSS